MKTEVSGALTGKYLNSGSSMPSVMKNLKERPAWMLRKNMANPAAMRMVPI
jgi:hypothetical protein